MLSILQDAVMCWQGIMIAAGFGLADDGRLAVRHPIRPIYSSWRYDAVLMGDWNAARRGKLELCTQRVVYQVCNAL